MKVFEVSVLDATGRVQTYATKAVSRVAAVESFRVSVGWSHRRMQRRLRRVVCP